MTVDCIVQDPRWDAHQIASLAETAIDATLARLGLEPSVFDVSLMVCDDARIAVLNADFRGKPAPTNVLSWPSAERGAETPGDMPHPPEPEDFGPTELGDIALAYDTCVAEAAAADKPLAEHATHLLVHGTLHLLGFDHIHEADAVLMEGLETEILGKLGLADPYSQA